MVHNHHDDFRDYRLRDARTLQQPNGHQCSLIHHRRSRRCSAHRLTVDRQPIGQLQVHDCQLQRSIRNVRHSLLLHDGGYMGRREPHDILPLFLRSDRSHVCL